MSRERDVKGVYLVHYSIAFRTLSPLLLKIVLLLLQDVIKVNLYFWCYDEIMQQLKQCCLFPVNASTIPITSTELELTGCEGYIAAINCSHYIG